MPRAPVAFKQRDVTRAIKAVTAAGVEIARVEISKNGQIIIVPKGSEESPAAVNPWDKLTAEELKAC